MIQYNVPQQWVYSRAIDFALERPSPEVLVGLNIN